MIGRSVAHFRIDAQLGEGGMGVVYRATDEKLRRKVALKLLPDAVSGDEERRRRFLREARSAAAVTHNNIAAVYDVGEADGHVYIAMELVPGATLRKTMAARETGLTHAEALCIAREVAKGLSRAHENGVVHRDLKPENVMITPDGDVKILDFGLAKVIDMDTPAASAATADASQVTEEGRIMGTPAYMSPEQAEGRTDIDARSDVFSFGVMLYEMLSGVRPFDGQSAVAILYAVVHRQPEPLDKLCPELPPRAAEVVARCLQKAPTDRYASAGELLSALGGRESTPASDVASGQAAQPAPLATVSGMGTALGATVAADVVSSAPSPRAGGRRVAVAAALLAAIAGAAWWRYGRDAPIAHDAPVDAAAVEPARASATPGAPRYTDQKLSEASEREFAASSISPDGSQILLLDEGTLWVEPAKGGTRQRLDLPPLGPAQEVVTASFFRDGARVLVSIGKGPEVDTYVAPIDGGRPDLLTALHGGFWQLSPDGKRVAPVLKPRMEVTSLDGGARTLVFQCAPMCGGAAWSPDGRNILVLSPPSSLVVARADASASHVLLDDPTLDMEGAAAIAWPTSDRIVFGGRAQDKKGYVTLQEIAVDPDGNKQSPQSQPHEIWRTRGNALTGLNVSGQRMTVGLEDLSVRQFVAALSPDGRRVMGQHEGLSLGEPDWKTATWLSDGRLAFVGNHDGVKAIYAQAPGAAHWEVLVSPPVSPDVLVVLRSGELIYARPETDASPPGDRLYVGRPHGPERVLDARVSALHCGGGEPSRCVAVTSDGKSRSYASLDVESGRLREPLAMRSSFSTFDVSPDGRTLAIVDGSPKLELLSIADQSTRFVLTDPAAGGLWSVVFAPDGQSLLISGVALATSACGLIRAGLDGRGVQLLGSAAAPLHAIVSPDGKRIAWSEDRVSSTVLLIEPESTR